MVLSCIFFFSHNVFFFSHNIFYSSGKIISFENAFNSDNSKILSFGKDIITYSFTLKLQEVTSALEKFADYHIIWENDRDEELEKFMADNPKLTEFESKIKYYEELEVSINGEPEYYDVGPIALFTGKFCFLLITY